MHIDVGKELTSLRGLAMGELRRRFAELCGETTNVTNRTWLLKRMGWALQAKIYGGLSERALRRVEELAAEAALRILPPRDSTGRPEPRPAPKTKAAKVSLLPGTVIIRKYKGQTLQVKALTKGFEFAGKTYASLTAVAEAITGSHCNGFLFFRLGKYGAPR